MCVFFVYLECSSLISTATHLQRWLHNNIYRRTWRNLTLTSISSLRTLIRSTPWLKNKLIGSKKGLCRSRFVFGVRFQFYSMLGGPCCWRQYGIVSINLRPLQANKKFLRLFDDTRWEHVFMLYRDKEPTHFWPAVAFRWSDSTKPGPKLRAQPGFQKNTRLLLAATVA